MEAKKSKQADLESKRGSILLLGMVCATSVTLMSFEYANYELKSPENLMSSVVTEDPWVMPVYEVVKPVTQVTEEVKESDEVMVDDEPEMQEEEIVEEKNDELADSKNFTIPKVPEEFIIKDTLVWDSIPEPVIPDKMPQFPGGLEAMYAYLSQEIDYPYLCKENGVQGKVYIQFTVEMDGSITGINVVKTPHQLMSEESSSVVSKMPNWEPGLKDGKPVRVIFTLPVNFLLE